MGLVFQRKLCYTTWCFCNVLNCTHPSPMFHSHTLHFFSKLSEISLNLSQSFKPPSHWKKGGRGCQLCICCNKWFPGTLGISTSLEIAVGTHIHVMALKLPCYFYLLMEQLLDCYFQVQFPQFKIFQIALKGREELGKVWFWPFLLSHC